MAFREALKTYTVLTVGDGPITMIPSLLVSMAGGMVVIRASSNTALSADLGTQLLCRRRSLQIALSPAPFAGTLSPQLCGALSAGNSSHGSGAVAGYGALSLD
jgi:type III secretory pathway component EscV